MNAEIVVVGTEILLGQIVDTNSAELGKVLAKFGVFHTHRQTVGDNLGRLADALRLALSRSDIVFTIGGLGPTQDDLTRDGIVEALGDKLVYDDSIEQGIRERLSARGVQFVPSMRNQAYRPSSATVLDNPNGTAPGLLCRVDGKTLIAMPGPRAEFMPMLEGPVSEFLRSVSEGVIHSRVLRVAGMGESMIESKIFELMKMDNPTVAPYAKVGEVHLRVSARAATVEEAEAMIAPVEEEIRNRLGDAVFSVDERPLQEVVLAMLRERGETLAVAESCTGGGLGAQITSVAGSSAAFLGGVISYSNETKSEMLGVSAETLETHGAVSSQAACEMAEGVRERTGADWGVSITGIAGPGGGSEEKPVGLVYIGVAEAGGTTVEKNVFPGQRDAIRARTIQQALVALRKRVAATEN
ncbi:MAG: competence/damage-inducible protein A [Armatimonadetes bacterium]|nr:competence/damage-inducible protein A [Armatimonadota bacterium]